MGSLYPIFKKPTKFVLQNYQILFHSLFLPLASKLFFLNKKWPLLSSEFTKVLSSSIRFLKHPLGNTETLFKNWGKHAITYMRSSPCQESFSGSRVYPKVPRCDSPRCRCGCKARWITHPRSHTACPHSRGPCHIVLCSLGSQLCWHSVTP